jgi:CHASE3 domain sensor protein
MSKEHRVKAMAKVINACARIKDKKPLAEAVRAIVNDMFAEEAEFRELERAKHAENAARKRPDPNAPPPF